MCINTLLILYVQTNHYSSVIFITNFKTLVRITPTVITNGQCFQEFFKFEMTTKVCFTQYLK